MLSLAISDHSWQPSMQETLHAMGIQLYQSKNTRTCQLCWKHKSKYRRKCPICERLIAPGCMPVQCWSDDFNHCRECHSMIGVIRHIRVRRQCLPCDPDLSFIETSAPKPQSNVISYMVFPVEVQIKIMIFAFQLKDLVGMPCKFVKKAEPTKRWKRK